MVYLHICVACRQGLHSSCEGDIPAPPDTFGGSRCTCVCRLGPVPDNPRKFFEGIKILKKTRPK